MLVCLAFTESPFSVTYLIPWPNIPGSSEFRASWVQFFSESKTPVSHWGVCRGSCLAMQGGGSNWESYFSFYRLSMNPPIFRPILYPYTLQGTWYLHILSPSGVLWLELHCFLKTLGFTFLYSASLVYHSFICLWSSKILSTLSPALVSSVLFMLVSLQFLFYLYNLY